MGNRNQDRSDGSIALVVEGGGMRGIFSAGVLDAFMEMEFDPFNLYIGVSAGACNLASHLGGQYQRNYKIYTQYCTRPEFMNLKKFLLGGHYLDTDWLWDILDEELPPKPDVATSRPGKPFVVVVTDVARGTAMYLEPAADNLRYYLKASSAMPVLYRKVLNINGVPVIDGGVADSIPVQEAVRRGANKILVLRSRPSSYVKKHNLLALISMKVFHYRQRALQKTFKQRPQSYMNALRFISNPPNGLEIRQLGPPESTKLERNSVDQAILEEAYRQGRTAGKRFVVEFQTVGF
jgi:predicted patatin/cPLA2 family phospholipase